MVAVDGLLDATSGASLLAALDSLMLPTGPDDDRTAPQRRADALTHLARSTLDNGRLPSRGGHKPHLSVLVDAGTLRREPGARGAELAGVGVVPGETARRLGCDALVTTITIDGSDVLDVGRTQRLVPDRLRKALAVRDGGCVFPGCDRPPGWCDAHHLHHWAAGGETSLANTALLCRWHHTYLHEGRWTLARHSDGAWTATHPHGDTRHRPPAPTLAPP